MSNSNDLLGMTSLWFLLILFLKNISFDLKVKFLNKKSSGKDTCLTASLRILWVEQEGKFRRWYYGSSESKDFNMKSLHSFLMSQFEKRSRLLSLTLKIHMKFILKTLLEAQGDQDLNFKMILMVISLINNAVEKSF